MNNQELMNQELMNQELMNQELMNQDLIGQDLSGQDLIGQDLSGQDLSEQDLINKILTHEKTINQLYNKNYYLMEIMSDKEIKFYEQQLELHNKLNTLTEEFKSYKKSVMLPISKLEIDKKYEILDQTNKQLEHSNMELDQTNKQLDQSNMELEQKNKELKEKYAIIKQTNMELEQKNKELKEKYAIIEQTNKELEQSNMELEQSNMELEQKNKELKEKDAENIKSVPTDIVDTTICSIVEPMHDVSWSGIVSGKEQPIKEISKIIPDLSNSTIISAKVGDYNLYPNALQWKSLHRHVCKIVIKKYSVDYLIQHSSIKIVKDNCKIRGYITRLGISIQYANTLSIYKDIDCLLRKINDPLKLTIKLSNETLYTF